MTHEIDDARELEQAAHAAFARGDTIFSIQLVVRASGRMGWFLDTEETTRANIAQSVAMIEGAGWHLDNVGYVFVPEEQSTRRAYTRSAAVASACVRSAVRSLSRSAMVHR